MMIFFRLFPAAIYLPVGIYLYHVFGRMLSLFGIRKGSWPSRSLSALFAAACAAAGWRVYGLGAVIVMHFVAVSLVVELINGIIRRKARSERLKNKWNLVYRSGIIGVLATAVILGYGYVNIYQVQKTEYTIHTGKALPGGELTIAQISDLHMGTTMDAEKLQEYCDAIEQEEPDLLALTGDIFDESTSREEMEAAVKVLSGVQTTYGIYYIFGNHDYNRYVREAIYTEDELRDTLRAAGIRVLEDETAQVAPGVTVIGRTDASRERGEISGLVPEEKESFYLLLDHQPVELEKNAEAGIDLQLSGHTHAGQIWPTGQLNSLFDPKRVNYGLKQLGDYQVIVSSGIAGWGYPIRTGGNSEYVIIHVQSGEAA